MKEEIFKLYVEAVCKRLRIEKADLMSVSHRAELVDARYLLYYVCFSRPMQICYIEQYMAAEGFPVSHSTILRGIRKIDSKMDQDRDYRILVDTVSDMVA